MLTKEEPPDEEATRTARELLSELRERHGVSFRLRDPVVYCLGSSRLKEMAMFFARDFLLWPLAAFKGRTPYLGVYSGSGVSFDNPVIILTYGNDLETLEHEVRHHFSHECRRRPYLGGSGAVTFLREYYWNEKHSRLARKRLQALKKAGTPWEMDEKLYREILYVMECLSRKEFPRSRYLPDAVADIINEAQPWVSEGFAAEGGGMDVARVPLKLFLAASTAGVVYVSVRSLLSAGPGLFLGLGYMCGGVLNISYTCLRSLPLDMGVLRWRRMRTLIRDDDIPKVLAYPPSKEKDLKEVLRKIEEYSIFQP